jgi:hypothetical protein
VDDDLGAGMSPDVSMRDRLILLERDLESWAGMLPNVDARSMWLRMGPKVSPSPFPLTWRRCCVRTHCGE